MQLDWLWITLLVLGFIASNLMLLKYTARFKMTARKDPLKPDASGNKQSVKDAGTDQDSR